jgi:ABC-type sugar transport system substrate-binding protein
MRKKILLATIFTALSVALLLLPILQVEVQAKDKIGWVGPVYKELSASLTKGFKAYYKKTYGKNVDITLTSSWAQALQRMKSQRKRDCSSPTGQRIGIRFRPNGTA